MAMLKPGILRFNLYVLNQEVVTALRPYVVTYCPASQIKKLQPGKRVRVSVPTHTAAVELYPLIFAYSTPERLALLRDLIVAAGGTPPKLDIQDDTDIGWLGLKHTELPFRRVGIEVVGDLTSKTETELEALPGIGAIIIRFTKERLKANGLSLRQK